MSEAGCSGVFAAVLFAVELCWLGAAVCLDVYFSCGALLRLAKRTPKANRQTAKKNPAMQIAAIFCFFSWPESGVLNSGTGGGGT